MPLLMDGREKQKEILRRKLLVGEGKGKKRESFHFLKGAYFLNLTQLT